MWRLLCFSVGLFVLVGCGEEGNRREITVTRSGSADTVAPAGSMNTAERMGFRQAPDAGMGGMGAAASGPQYVYETPEGWTEAATTSLRQVNFTIDESGECYFTVLGGTGGGLAANINRWRKQMGLGDLSEEEVEALPSSTLLGHDAVAVDFEGAFSGMGNEAQEGYRLLGRVAVADGNAYFAKFTGPAALVEAHEEAFNTFCDSLKADPMAAAAAAHASAGLPAMPSGMGGQGMANVPAVGGFNSMDLVWDAPEGWTQAPDRAMRLVTYTVGEAECYVAVLSGMAGGVDANINRWRQQMGQPALTELELAALPKLTVLGEEASLVEISGEYTGMGETRNANYGLLGVVCPLEGQTLFVKMVGPAETLAEETESFKRFCQSLRHSS